MNTVLINVGASTILGTNIMALIIMLKHRESYPDISKALSGLGLAIALLGFVY